MLSEVKLEYRNHTIVTELQTLDEHTRLREISSPVTPSTKALVDDKELKKGYSPAETKMEPRIDLGFRN